MLTMGPVFAGPFFVPFSVIGKAVFRADPMPGNKDFTVFRFIWRYMAFFGLVCSPIA